MKTDKNIVLIITTKNYPLDWESYGEKLDVENYLLDFDSNKKESFFKEKPYVTKCSFGKCNVFVVPCLNGGDAGNKGSYLNAVFKVCLGTLEDYSHVYFVAHDKDFVAIGKGCNDFVKPEQINEMNCAPLDKLVSIKHVYMYQHGETEVGKFIAKFNDGFAHSDCDKLLNEIVIGKIAMNEFFMSVNSIINTYPSET